MGTVGCERKIVAEEVNCDADKGDEEGASSSDCGLRIDQMKKCIQATY